MSGSASATESVITASSINIPGPVTVSWRQGLQYTSRRLLLFFCRKALADMRALVRFSASFVTERAHDLGSLGLCLLGSILLSDHIARKPTFVARTRRRRVDHGGSCSRGRDASVLETRGGNKDSAEPVDRLVGGQGLARLDLQMESVLTVSHVPAGLLKPPFLFLFLLFRLWSLVFTMDRLL